MAATMTTTTASATGNNQNIADLQKRIDAANAALKNYNTTSSTDEQLRKRAESEYNPVYNASVAEQNALKQSAQATLDKRLAALNNQYQRDAAALGESYDTQRATTNNTMLARGFNNSSLAAAMLNSVERRRNDALADLQRERTASETAAQDEYAGAVSAADAAIARLGSDLAANIDARVGELRDAEEQRVFQAQQAQNQLTQYTNDLMLQIEALRQQALQSTQEQTRWEEELALQKAQDAAAQAQWEKEYGLNEREVALAERQYEDSIKKSSSSGSRSSSGSASGGSSAAAGASSGSSGSSSWLASMYDQSGAVQSMASTIGKTLNNIASALKKKNEKSSSSSKILDGVGGNKRVSK